MASDSAPEGLTSLVWRLLNKCPLPVTIASVLLLILCIGIPAGYQTNIYMKDKLNKEKAPPTAPPAAVPTEPAPKPVAVHSISDGDNPYATKGEKIAGHAKGATIGEGSYSPQQGDKYKDYPQNRDANESAGEDEASSAWHTNHPEDTPPLLTLPGTSKDHLVQYKYYKATDGCIWLRRVDLGVPSDGHWNRDPLHVQHHATNQQTHLGSALPPAATETPADIVNRIKSFSAAPVFAAERPRLLRVQGTCLNPHPGNYQWWWGAPINQCETPQYRRFADGCTHYQIYNRCSNSWYLQINWTLCVAQHSW